MMKAQPAAHSRAVLSHDLFRLPLILLLTTVFCVPPSLAQQRESGAIHDYLNAMELLGQLSLDELTQIDSYSKSDAVQEDPMLRTLLMRYFPARNEIVKGSRHRRIDPNMMRHPDGRLEYSTSQFNASIGGIRFMVLLAAHARWSIENNDPAGAQESIATGYRLIQQFANEGRSYESQTARNFLMQWTRIVRRVFEAGGGTIDLAAFALEQSQFLDPNDPVNHLGAYRYNSEIQIHQRLAALDEGGIEGLARRSGPVGSPADLSPFSAEQLRRDLETLPERVKEVLAIIGENDDVRAKSAASELDARLKESSLVTIFPFDPLSLRSDRLEMVRVLAEHQAWLRSITTGEVDLDALVNGAVLFLRAGANWRSIPEETRAAFVDMDDLSDAAILAMSNEDVLKHVQTLERVLKRAADCRVLDFYSIYHGAGGDHVRPVNREILAALDAMAFAERRMLHHSARLKPDDALRLKATHYASLIRNAEHLGHEINWNSSILAVRRCEELLGRVEELVRSRQLDQDSRAILMVALTEVRNADDPFGFSFSEDRDRSELELVWSVMHGMHRDSAWRKNIRAKIAAFTPWQRFVVRVLLEANRTADPNFDLVRDLDRRLGTALASVLDDQWSMLRIQTGRTNVEPVDIDAAFGAQEPKVDLEALDARIDALQQALAAQ